MFNLLKYEFLRKYKSILMTIVITAVINLIAIYSTGEGGSTMMIGVFPIAMVFVYIFDVIKIYSDDINKISGYMLFMTPNSGYKIILSKIITAILEGIGILLLYFTLVVANGFYLMAKADFTVNINEIINFINRFLDGSFGFDLGHVFVMFINIFIFIIGFIMTVYTAITIRKSIFSEIKFGGFLSFVIFILLNWSTTYLSSKILPLFTPVYENMVIIGRNGVSVTVEELIVILLPMAALSIIESVLMIIGSGYLLEHKINL